MTFIYRGKLLCCKCPKHSLAYADVVQLPQGYSHLEEAVYFLWFSSQKFLVLILSTSEEWKADSTLELPSGFEHGTPNPAP